MRIEIPNIRVADPAGVTAYPFQDSLTSLFYLGGGELASTKNRALGGVDATVHGDITYSPLFATFEGLGTVNYLQTAEFDADTNQTIVGIYRMPGEPDASDPGRSIFSAYNGIVIPGLALVNSGGYQSTGAGVDTVFGGDDNGYSSTFRFRALTVNDADASLYTVEAGQVALKATTAVTRTLNTASPLRIGGDYYAGGMDDTCDIAFVSKHTGEALTLEKLQYVYQFLKARYASRGVRVL